MAKAFEKFEDEYLGYVSFDFQANKRVTGNRILKTFLKNSLKFK